MKQLNIFYILIVLLFFGMLYINHQFFRGSSFSNIGIAYAKEYKISSEKSGLVKNIHVVPGQEVKAGDLLVEMENAAMEIAIVKLSTKVESLKKEKLEKHSLVQSRIAYLKAEGGIKMEDLQSQIQQIETEQELNRRLTGQYVLEGIAPARTPAKEDPNALQISSLEEKKKLYGQAMGIRIEDYLKDHQAALLVLENEINLNERELELLLNEKAKLNKYAIDRGVVKSVFVRSGEEVQAFSAMISVNPRHPSTVVAYVVGPKGREVAVGETVKVSAYNKKFESMGEVIGFGSIVELPEILQKSTAVKAFGKEVFIKIPEENGFANGEKVLIR